MMKTATRMIMAAAATSMAVLPVAAQANTRAGDSGTVYSSAQPGLGRAAEGESVASGLSIIIALFSSALIIGGIIFATESDDEGQSPGT